VAGRIRYIDKNHSPHRVSNPRHSGLLDSGLITTLRRALCTTCNAAKYVSYCMLLCLLRAALTTAGSHKNMSRETSTQEIFPVGCLYVGRERAPIIYTSCSENHCACSETCHVQLAGPILLCFKFRDVMKVRVRNIRSIKDDLFCKLIHRPEGYEIIGIR
jgi:hypothetical protein